MAGYPFTETFYGSNYCFGDCLALVHPRWDGNQLGVDAGLFPEAQPRAFFRRNGGAWRYFPGHFCVYFGWDVPVSAFLVQAYRNAIKDRRDHFVLFSLIAASVIILFFSFSGTKLPNYTVPCYPFLAILLGSYFSKISELKTKIKPSYISLLIIGICLVPALIVGLQFDPLLKDIKLVGWYFLPASIGIIIGFYFFIQKKNQTGILVTGSSTILASLLFFLFVFPRIDAQNPVRKSMSLVEGKEIRYFQKFNPSYSFYLKKLIPEISENEIERFFEKYRMAY